MTLPAPDFGGIWTPLVLGMAFGVFLEQGGMGSARKISGQFQLSDFSVLKVMFSAIVTAALGLFWLSRLGIVNYDEIFLVPTYIWPQLVGGLIFGAGFVTASLCPGTACVALSSGHLDGAATLVGLLSGIVFFNETFEFLSGFYYSGSLGPIAIPDWMEISHGVALLGLTTLAAAAFFLAEIIESRAQTK